jgi:hypothetical protein
VVAPPPATTFKVDARLLVLVKSGFKLYDFLTTVAMGYGEGSGLHQPYAPAAWLYDVYSVARVHALGWCWHGCMLRKSNLALVELVQVALTLMLASA